MIATGERNGGDPAPLRLASGHRPLLAATAFGTVGVVVPPYLTAFFVRLPGEVEPLLLLPIALMPLVAAAVQLRVRRAWVEVGPDGLHEQRVLGRDRFTPTSAMASLVVLRLIEMRTLRASRQLFVRDERGRTLFRMREVHWGERQLDAVRRGIPLAARTLNDPLTVAEVRHQRVVLLPWWERSPIARGLVLTVAILVGALLLLLPVMSH